jgi:HlyD family secretion protein
MKPRSLIVGLALTAACGTPATVPSEPDPTEAVHAAAPRAEARTPEFVGVVSSRVSKVIAADFEGKVERLAIRNGQRVRAGQIVAELDATELYNKLDQARGAQQAAKGQAARAGAAFSNARRRANLEQRLIRSGAAAPEAYRSAMAEASQYGADGSAARGEIQRTASQIAELEQLIAKAKVPAPLDGVISVVKLKEGELAHKGAPIARVFDPDELVVRFAVPRGHAAKVKPGTSVELVTKESAQVVPATVQREDTESDPSINFTVFEAVIDPTYRIDEIRVGDHGQVRIAARGAAGGKP